MEDKVVSGHAQMYDTGAWQETVLCLFLSTYKMFPQYFTLTFVLVTLSQNVCKKEVEIYSLILPIQ